MLSFRFIRDNSGDIIGVSAHDYTLKFSGVYVAESVSCAIVYKHNIDSAKTEYVCDLDLLHGCDDYRRKFLRRVVVNSEQFQNALDRFISDGNTLTTYEINIIFKNANKETADKIFSMVCREKGLNQLLDNGL